MKYYLKTPYPCDIYNIQVAPWNENGTLNESECIVFDESQKEPFERLVKEIRNCMENFWAGHRFIGSDNYSYVTTGHSSHLRSLYVTTYWIEKEENTITCRCNYFSPKSNDAQELCRHLKDIFRKYGITIE